MKKQFLLSLIANGMRVLLGFVFFWQVSQALGLATLGEYLYVTVALGYFGTLIDYGFNLFVLNAASREPASVRSLFLRVVLSKLILTGISFAILTGLYGVAFAEQGILVTVLFFAVVILQSFSGLMIQFFKALGRFEHELTTTMFSSILPVVILFALQNSVTLVTLGWTVVMVRLLVVLFQLAIFLQISQGQVWTESDNTAESCLLRAIRDIRRNFNYAVFSILGAILLSIDLVIMRFILTPEDVALYGTAMKVILAVVLLFEVLSGVFVPRLARDHGKGATYIRTSAHNFAIIMISCSATTSLILIVFGSSAVSLAFGQKFAEAGNLLNVLALFLFFRVLTMVSGSLLTVTGYQWARTIIMTTALPIHILINLTFQKWFGYWGAAYALVTTYFFLVAANFLALYFLTDKNEVTPHNSHAPIK